MDEIGVQHFNQLLVHHQYLYRNHYQSCQTRIGPGSPTGLTENRIEIRFFKYREPDLLEIP